MDRLNLAKFHGPDSRLRQHGNWEELIRERINAGLNRARAEGKKLGRPSVWNTPQVINSVKLLREKQMPIHAIAKNLRIGVGTVAKILAAA